MPAKSVGSLRIAPPCTQAGGRGERAAPARSVRTIAQAPSEEGQVSEYRIGSHSIGEAWTFSRVMSCSCRCAYGFFSALRRSL